MTIISLLLVIQDFVTVLNEEKKYAELKKSIRTMNNQRSDVEKISLIE